MPSCPNCDTELERIKTIVDCYDPTERHGHAQYEEDSWGCSECGYTEENS